MVNMMLVCTSFLLRVDLERSIYICFLAEDDGLNIQTNLSKYQSMVYWFLRYECVNRCKKRLEIFIVLDENMLISWKILNNWKNDAVAWNYFLFP